MPSHPLAAVVHTNWLPGSTHRVFGGQPGNTIPILNYSTKSVFNTNTLQCNNRFQIIISAEARWMRTEPVPVPSQSEAPLSLRHPPACQHPSGNGYLVQVAFVASSPRKCPWGHQVFDAQSIRACQAARFQNHITFIYRYINLWHV